MIIALCVRVWSTDLRKRLDRATYSLHLPKFEARLIWSPPSWWEHPTHQSFGFSVRRLWIQNVCKPLVKNPRCCPKHRCFIDIFTNWALTAQRFHQDGRRRFLAFKNETTEASSSLFFRSVVRSLLSIVFFHCPWATPVWRLCRRFSSPSLPRPVRILTVLLLLLFFFTPGQRAI